MAWAKDRFGTVQSRRANLSCRPLQLQQRSILAHESHDSEFVTVDLASDEEGDSNFGEWFSHHILEFLRIYLLCYVALKGGKKIGVSWWIGLAEQVRESFEEKTFDTVTLDFRVVENMMAQCKEAYKVRRL